MVTSHAYKLIDTTLLSAIINEQYFVLRAQWDNVEEENKISFHVQ